MQHRKVKQDAFQSELTAALKIRRQKEVLSAPLEEETEESDSDDYIETDDYDDDDFDEEDEQVPSTSKISPAKLTKKSSEPWDPFNDDDDDFLGGGGSMFMKGKEKKTFTKATFDPMGMGKKLDVQTKSIPKEEYSESDSSAEDPILALLKSDKPKKKKQQPTPAKRVAAKKELEGEVRSYQKRSLSPDLVAKSRTKSPDGRVLSPKGRKSPVTGHLSTDPFNPFGEPHQVPSESTRAQKHGLERQRHISSESRPKTPGSGKESPELKGILDTMKSKDIPDVLSTEPRERKKVPRGSESIVDFLLDPSQPKPAPRSKESKPSSVKSESRKPSTRSLSPTSKLKEKSDSDLKKHGSLFGERETSSSSWRDERTKSPTAQTPRNDRQQLSSLPLPSLQPKGISLSATTIDTMPKSVDRRALGKAEKEKITSDADDILALFNRSVTGEKVDFEAHVQQKQEEREQKNPIEAVVHKTAEQKTQDYQRQRPSRQLMDNVIENVAYHNDGSDVSFNSMPPSEGRKKTPRPKTGKKSYRTPPTNYQGLGSMTMLQELKKKDAKLNNTCDGSISTEDIRKQVYLEWLAKREEEAKKKRKEEAEKKKKEVEKKKEEREEKEKENMLVRQKWEEDKVEQLKEKAREKRKEERKQSKEQEEKEKQKVKSDKEAEKRRQRMCETAKIQHRAEMRKKQEEQRKIKRREEKQKEESQKTVQKWMDNRSEQWVEDRTKEQREKRKQERRAKKDKEGEMKEAEEKYNNWRERKDNELKTTMRENRMKQRRQRLSIEEDEENCRPPWSPASKVIPRHR